MVIRFVMKNKKTLGKLVFVAVVVLIVYAIFRKSIGDIIAQIQATTWQSLLLLCVFSFVYLVLDGIPVGMLAKQCNPNFKIRWGIFCAFYCAFYRLTTVGSAAGVAAVYYLGGHEVDYSESISLYTVQYAVHRLSIAVFTISFFLCNWGFMARNFVQYTWLLFIAFAATIFICIIVVLFVISPRFHKVILALGHKLNWRNMLGPLLAKLEAGCEMMEHLTGTLIHNLPLMIKSFLVNFVKQFFWFSIPFLVLLGSSDLSWAHSLTITALAVMTSSVIPLPAGLGSTEVIMTGLFSVVVGVHKAGAVTVLYRAATFILPFLFGAVAILLRKIFAKRTGRDIQVAEPGKFQ